MIDFINVSKHFGTQDVLVDVSFRINAGERVGIVGPNGAGKSTIFNLISGHISPDSGELNCPRKLKIGYLRQQLHPHRVQDSLLEYAENAIPELHHIQHELHSLELRLSGEPGGQESDMRRLGELQSRFEHLGGYVLKTRAEATLCGLGFNPAELDNPFKSFSGGWQMRAELSRVLVAQPDILMLDEPTNYLDVPAVEWLNGYLRDFPGTLLLISHDRYLLNTLVNVTLDVGNGRVERYAGNYDHFIEERRSRYEQLLAAKQNVDRRRDQIERFVERFRSKNTKASQVQSRIKMLDKLDEVEVPQDLIKPPAIRLATPARSGAEVIRVTDGGLSYDGRRWIFRHLDFRLESGMKAAVVGPNGLGKTTLLRVLAGKLALTEGQRAVGHNVQIGYQSQDFTDVMAPDLTVFETARRVSGTHSDSDVRSLLGSFRFSGDATDKRVEILSGGEKVRLALARLLLGVPNFVLLDEPTTHLDIASRESLENALRDYAGTVCLVSHDIQFIRNVATTIFEITPNGIVRYYGNYDYYREKKAERADLVEETSALTEKPAGKGQERRDRKREEAELRQAFYRRQRPLAEAARNAETRIEKLELERAALLQQLADTAANTDYAAVNRRLAEVQAGIDQATSEWETAELALEELKAELLAEA